jgi:hypothetical protein
MMHFPVFSFRMKWVFSDYKGQRVNLRFLRLVDVESINRNYSAILATLQITLYALGV